MSQQYDKNTRARSNTAVSVTTTAGVAVAEDLNRIGVVFHNAHATEAIYLGDSSVSSSNGFRLVAGATFEDWRSSAAWHCRTASGTSDLRVLTFY